MSIWDFLFWLFWVYLWAWCIWLFITVIIDVFRDSSLTGGAKALWVIFLIAVPFLAAFIYIVVRGQGMSRRNPAVARQAYGRSAVSEIEAAKRLLDSGAINAAEYDTMKATAISKYA